MPNPLIPSRFLEPPYLDWELGFFGVCRWTLTAEGHSWMIEEKINDSKRRWSDAR